MVRAEIGSEFWDIPQSPAKNDLFPPHTGWFLSGRGALSAVLERLLAEHRVRNAGLPAWCCDSMIAPFLARGISVSFYPVFPDLDGGLRCELSAVSDCDILLVMDYFGYVRTAELSAFRGAVVRDLTHSVLSLVPLDADYYFGSLRKWAGFWTGGFAWTRNGAPLPAVGAGAAQYVALRSQAMEWKTSYLMGARNDKAYLDVFAHADAVLEADPRATAADKRDIAAALHLDAEQLRRRRRENAQSLLDGLRELQDIRPIFPIIKENDVPLFVPVLVQDGKRDELRSWLTTKQIYCPVHWPVSELHRLDTRTAALYKAELSLVCDQRYGTDDMQRIIDTISEFYRR